MLALVAPLPAVDVPLEDAAGHVLAAPAHAAAAVPPFDAVAMDGFAVRSADLAGRTPTTEVALRVVGAVAAAAGGPGPAVGPGEAVQVMTGAPVPPGADAVVPVERTSWRRFDPTAPAPATATVGVRADPGARPHVRPRGEDLRPGDLLGEPGDVVGPPLVAAAAAAGLRTLPVRRAPLVGVVSTGSELVPVGDVPAPGQIPDSNSLMLAAAVRAAGARVERVGAVPDTVPALSAVLDDLAARVDLLVTTGGVSAGAHDVVRALLAGRAPQVTEGEAAAVGMQPGRPQVLARWRGVPWVAVPGSPVAAFVSTHLFVLPAVRRLRGEDGPPRLVGHPAAQAWSSPAGREQVLPVRLDDDGRVRPAGPSGGHRLGALARADALAVVPADVTAVSAGDVVPVLVLPGRAR